MIAVCAAMERELSGLERRLSGVRPVDGGGYLMRSGHLGGAVVTCRTGIGRRSDEAARSVLSLHRPRALLSVGLCGALDPDLRVGDIILCESVAEGPASASEAPSDSALLRRAEATAEASGSTVRRGRFLTVDSVVGAAEKEALRRSTGRDIVEMESFWLATAARERDVPFLAIRAVLDRADESIPLPEGVAVRGDGSTRALRVLTYVLSHPGSLGPLMRTARARRRAIDSLSQFLEAFIGALQATPVGGAGTAV